jgi:GNAT superfamily N-acetyltransferase
VPRHRLEIRSALPGEAGLVLGFVKKLADYERLAHEVDASEAMLDRVLFGQPPRAFCEIAEWQGEPVGFALWFYSFSTFRGRLGIYLEDIFVEPAHRGRGIGKAMLVRLARRCVEEGLPRFEWSVLDWNVPSIAFYQSLGAVAMDQWTVYRLAGDALHRLATEAPAG